MKRYIKLFSIFFLASIIFSACSDLDDPTIAPEYEEEPEEIEVTNTVIDVNTTYQTIESFAAADAWFLQFVGKYWSDSQKESIAKLLFSQNITGGQPEGIGLSGWRFNLGSGSLLQGEDSKINMELKRTDAFLDLESMATGTTNSEGGPEYGNVVYDWERHEGQRYFLEKAINYGCEQFVMFSGSPTVNLTKNGYGWSSSGGNGNLKEDAYDDFADYITESIKFLQNEYNMKFDYISPINEPQYDWAYDAGETAQDGTGWQNSEIAKLTRELNTSLTSKGLSTKIMLAESGDWTYLYSGSDARANVINNFFASGNENYVGDLEHVDNLVVGHSYHTEGNWNDMISTRKKVNEAATAQGLKVYQTEWSMLDWNSHYSTSEFVGFDNATYMDIALYMTKVMHSDISYANVSSWAYWTALAIERYSQLNRFFLIRIIPNGGDYSDNLKVSGTHSATKTLWALGNYSLFVRPGYKRVDISMDNYSKEFFGDAFISADGKKVVVVYSNLSTEKYDAKATIDGVSISTIRTYTTDSSSDLLEASIASTDSSIVIQPQSVVTVVYTLN